MNESINQGFTIKNIRGSGSARGSWLLFIVHQWIFGAPPTCQGWVKQHKHCISLMKLTFTLLSPTTVYRIIQVVAPITNTAKLLNLKLVH
jgi:hypothetical protein